MIGHTLKMVPGPRPQMMWTFVQAPLGCVPVVVFSWREETQRGTIYMSRAQFGLYKGSRPHSQLIQDRADHIQIGRRGQDTIPFGGLELFDEKSVRGFLERAKNNPVMRDDAFVVVSQIAQHHPEVQPLFTDWADRLPAAA